MTEPLAGPNSPLISGTLGFSCAPREGISALPAGGFRMDMGDGSGGSNQPVVSSESLFLNPETAR